MSFYVLTHLLTDSHMSIFVSDYNLVFMSLPVDKIKAAERVFGMMKLLVVGVKMCSWMALSLV